MRSKLQSLTFLQMSLWTCMIHKTCENIFVDLNFLKPQNIFKTVWSIWFVLLTEGGEVLVAEMESADDVELFKDYEASEHEGSGRKHLNLIQIS